MFPRIVVKHRRILFPKKRNRNFFACIQLVLFLLILFFPQLTHHLSLYICICICIYRCIWQFVAQIYGYTLIFSHVICRSEICSSICFHRPNRSYCAPGLPLADSSLCCGALFRGESSSSSDSAVKRKEKKGQKKLND